MKNIIRTIMAVLLIGMLTLTGCGLGRFGKPSVVSLAKDAMDNVKKVESAAVNVKTDGDVSAVYEALNIGMNINLDSETDMELTKEPRLARGNTALTVGAVGQEQTINGNFYRESNEENSTIYVKWQNGDWMKKTTPVTKEADEEENNTNNAITMPESVTTVVGMLKYLSDGSVSAELMEETVQVNEKEAYQITSTLGGDFLKDMIDNGTIPLGGVNLEQAEIDWATVSVPAEIYIYKESKLPARITLDCTSIGSQIVGNLLKEELEAIPFGNIRLDVNRFIVDITIDRYNEIEAFEIPAEAAGAAESENLAPGLLDLFKF